MPDPGRSRPSRDGSLVLSEEELEIDVATNESGRVRARKVVDEERVEQVVPRGTEYAEVEHGPPDEVDSGLVETLPDGSVSIPVFEEQLVVEKRLVVRERIVIRKRTVFEDQRVDADLRRERVEVDADPEVSGRVEDGSAPARRPRRTTATPAERSKGTTADQPGPPSDGDRPAPTRRRVRRPRDSEPQGQAPTSRLS